MVPEITASAKEKTVALIAYLLESILYPTNIMLVFPIEETKERALGHAAHFFYAPIVVRKAEIGLAL